MISGTIYIYNNNREIFVRDYFAGKLLLVEERREIRIYSRVGKHIYNGLRIQLKWQSLEN